MYNDNVEGNSKHDAHVMCAPISELPSDTITMVVCFIMSTESMTYSYTVFKVKNNFDIYGYHMLELRYMFIYLT